MKIKLLRFKWGNKDNINLIYPIYIYSFLNVLYLFNPFIITTNPYYFFKDVNSF